MLLENTKNWTLSRKALFEVYSLEVITMSLESARSCLQPFLLQLSREAMIEKKALRSP